MHIRFTPEADAELAEAANGTLTNARMDLEFMQCIDDALSRIVNNPHLFPLVYRSFRRAVVRRFPFAVFYEVMADEIEVFAIFHSRRDPDAWKSRVR